MAATTYYTPIQPDHIRHYDFDFLKDSIEFISKYRHFRGNSNTLQNAIDTYSVTNINKITNAKEFKFFLKSIHKIVHNPKMDRLITYFMYVKLYNKQLYKKIDEYSLFVHYESPQTVQQYYTSFVTLLDLNLIPTLMVTAGLISTNQVQDVTTLINDKKCIEIIDIMNIDANIIQYFHLLLTTPTPIKKTIFHTTPTQVPTKKSSNNSVLDNLLKQQKEIENQIKLIENAERNAAIQQVIELIKKYDIRQEEIFGTVIDVAVNQ